MSPVSFAVISATPPHVADTVPDIAFADWLEIVQCRSVQLVICGNPGSVGEFHVPSKVDPDEVDPDDAEPEDADPEEVETTVSGIVRVVGAVGTSASVLCWNWHPLTSDEARRRLHNGCLVIWRSLRSCIGTHNFCECVTAYSRKNCENTRDAANTAGS